MLETERTFTFDVKTSHSFILPMRMFTRHFTFRVPLWSQVRSSPLAVDKAAFVLNRHDRIADAEYVADQLREPDYVAALQAV